MKITKTIKGNKITSISITFETDEEVGCLEDMITLSEREIANYAEFRTELQAVITQLKKEIA